MSCRFIEKYQDKLYTGELSFLESKKLMHHMESCSDCTLIYNKITRGNSMIKETILDVATPSLLTVKAIQEIDNEKASKMKVFKFKSYLAAAAVFLLIAASSIYYLLPGLKGQNYSGVTNPGTVSNTKGGNLKYPDNISNSDEFKNVLKSYISQKLGMTTINGHVFVAMDIFGSKEHDNLINVYLWALIEEYAWDQSLLSGSGTSIPVMVVLKRSGDSYDPQSFKIPGDGSYYTGDIKNIFPKEYQAKVWSRQGKVSDLEQEIRQEATQYFKNNPPSPETYGIPYTIINLLSKYGWHPERAEYVQNVKIPLSFADAPGDYPLGLYWAYNNVLSNDIGFDVSHYKGMDATAHIIPLKEEFGEGPNKKIRAVVIEVSDKIIGAWLDWGRSYPFLASLSKNYFSDIAKESWGQWLKDEGLVDYSENGYEGKLKSLTPEQVIEKYYDAIDRKDYKTAYSLMSKSNRAIYLSINKPDEKLYNDGFDGGMANTTSVKVIKITEWKNSFDIVPDKIFNRSISDKKMYQVDTEMTFKENIVRENGPNPWFVVMVKETPDAPWLIDSIGSGP